MTRWYVLQDVADGDYYVVYLDGVLVGDCVHIRYACDDGKHMLSVVTDSGGHFLYRDVGGHSEPSKITGERVRVSIQSCKYGHVVSMVTTLTHGLVRTCQPGGNYEYRFEVWPQTLALR